MSNVDFDLNLQRGVLTIEYRTLSSLKTICEKGYFSCDNRTFIITTNVIDSCEDLSPTERTGLKKYISQNCLIKDYPEIVFLERTQ